MENLNQFYFTEDAHITFTNSNFKGSKNDKKIEFEYLNKWFTEFWKNPFHEI